MGLSSKQVSGDGFGWAKNLMQTGALELPKVAQIRNHQQQQQQEVAAPLKCPRCDSSNTKFCYYNNYNRSQPRHYCKSCRRHWTKGGTLRNVPVGGGRKNKRQKTSNTTTTNNNNNNNNNKKKSNSKNNGMSNTIDIQPQQQQQHQPQQQLPIVFDDEKNLTDILYHSLIQPTTTDYLNNNNFLSSTTLSLDSLLPLPNYSSTSLSSLDNNPSSSMSSGRFQLPNIVFNYNGEINDPTTTVATTMTTTTTNMTPWEMPISTSNSMDPSTYWNWEDLNTIMSSSADVKPQWDIDSHTKQ